MIKFFTFACLLFAVTACNENTPTNSIELNEVTPEISNTEAENGKWQKATVKYFELEGGFWGIETDTGAKLLPMNLAKEYQQDNLEVMIQGEKQEGMMSIHQWGSPFNITAIKR